MFKILISIFHASVLFLIIVSLWPGSLRGYLFYGHLSRQPDLINNPFGPSINHLIYYFYTSLLGFALYLKNKNFNKLLFALIFFINNVRTSTFINTSPHFSDWRSSG